jgi:hypothetical protein
MTQKAIVDVDGVQKRDVYVSRESWLKRNAIPLTTAIVSMVVILSTFMSTYGRVTTTIANLESQLASYHTELAKIEVKIADVDSRVRAHHEDVSKHLDPDKWSGLQEQLKELRSLVIQHMQQSSRLAARP